MATPRSAPQKFRRLRRGFPAYGIRRPLANILTWGIGSDVIESVARDTPYRGAILIYAGSVDMEMTGLLLPRLAEVGYAQRNETARSASWTYDRPPAGLIGVVTLTRVLSPPECLPDFDTVSDEEWDAAIDTDAGFFGGPHAFMFSNPITFAKPIPYRGTLGPFLVPAERLENTEAEALQPGRGRYL